MKRLFNILMVALVSAAVISCAMDGMMETISNKGNGTYQHIDSEPEMVKVFVHENSR